MMVFEYVVYEWNFSSIAGILDLWTHFLVHLTFLTQNVMALEMTLSQLCTGHSLFTQNTDKTEDERVNIYSEKERKL